MQSVQRDYLHSVQRDCLQSVQTDCLQSVQRDYLQSVQRDCLQSVQRDCLQSVPRRESGRGVLTPTLRCSVWHSGLAGFDPGWRRTQRRLPSFGVTGAAD